MAAMVIDRARLMIDIGTRWGGASHVLTPPRLKWLRVIDEERDEAQAQASDWPPESFSVYGPLRSDSGLGKCPAMDTIYKHCVTSLHILDASFCGM